MDYEVEPLKREQIQHMTRRFRELIGYSNKVKLPIVDILEKVLPKLIKGFDWEVVPFDAMPDMHAKTCPDEGKIYIREDVYDGAVNGNGRDRSTIAHEIGHLILHGYQRPSFARAFADQKLPAYKSAEWQAKAFAAELLVPRHLCSSMSANEIMQNCGVSYESAQYQYNMIKKAEGGMPYGK